MLVELWLLFQIEVSDKRPLLNSLVTVVASTAYWLAVAAMLTAIVVLIA